MKAPGASTAPPKRGLPVLAAALVLGIAAGSSGGCASDGTGGGTAPSATDAPSADGGLPSAGEPGSPSRGAALEAGFYDPRARRGAGIVSSLTLVNEATQKGKLIASGRGQMDGGKVISEAYAESLAAAFEREGFDRFAVRVNFRDAPPGALGVVWIDRGSGVESLFLMPGARQDPRTRELPDIYDHLKKLILTIHMTTPGSMVTTGQGWSGDDMMNQKPERRR